MSRKALYERTKAVLFRNKSVNFVAMAVSSLFCKGIGGKKFAAVEPKFDRKG
jgi:hypothetical protein